MLQCLTCGRDLTQLQSAGGDCPSCATPIPAVVPAVATPPPTVAATPAPAPPPVSVAPTPVTPPVAPTPVVAAPPVVAQAAGNSRGMGLLLTLLAIIIVFLLGIVVLSRAGVGPFTGLF